MFLRNGERIIYNFRATDDGKIGVWPVGDLSRFFDLVKVDYSFLQAIPAGISKGLGNAISYLKQLKLIFTPKTKAYESLGGFIKIGSFFPTSWNWETFWEMTALLSIILAIMLKMELPSSALWAIGMLVGVSLVIHGWSFIAMARGAQKKPASG